MKQSLLFVPTLKEAPASAEVKSHKLMARAGLIKQTAAGIYTYLPLGYKVLKKIEAITREELDKRGCSELLMPALQPRDLWDETGRWDKYGPELMRLKDRKDREFCLGPTHEEVITSVVRDYLNSYKKLPLALYQIQTKFRDEMRPRFGLMRGREFIMKDLYTFHQDEADLDRWYDVMMEAYTAIFKRCGLETKVVASDVGQIGGDVAHEFMVMSEVGEDTIAYCSVGDYAANQEFVNLQAGDPCPEGEGVIETAQGIEVGNIFKLGTKYSESMNAYYNDASGERKPIVMGCYGIGISRTLMAAVEQNATETGLVWPAELTPYDIHVLPLTEDERIDVLVQELAQHYEVLIDDRDERAGIKFNDADLIGLPIHIVCGKGLKEDTVEMKNRRTNESCEVSLENVLKQCQTWLKN